MGYQGAGKHLQSTHQAGQGAGLAVRVLLLERWGPGLGKEVPPPKASPEFPLHCQETIRGRKTLAADSNAGISDRRGTQGADNG